MREIKFRAWNKVEGFMDSAWFIDWEHERVGHSKHSMSELGDCVVMQYTGLKDKNGVEIYEGDISFDEWNDCYGVVRFDEGKFVYERENICDDLTEARFCIEVLGNIYENPDLLEATQ